MTGISSKKEKRLRSTSFSLAQDWATQLVQLNPDEKLPSLTDEGAPTHKGQPLQHDKKGDEKALPTKMGYHEIEVRTYVLSANVDDGFVQFYFKDRPPRPNFDKDGPLEVRVPNDCWIRFILDPALHWRFRHKFKNLPGKYTPPIELPEDVSNEAVTLGDKACMELYSDLRHISSQEVMFFAWYCDDRFKCCWPADPQANSQGDQGAKAAPADVVAKTRDPDEFNIYVELEQMSAEAIPGKKKHYGKVLEIRIDPDMQNPGDDTGKHIEAQLRDLQNLLHDAGHDVESLRLELKRR